uniref:Uncharacterized protein n=1 Tax=Romanomermis culicivorax TaxID=13658 RepID=A0A915IB70_ROMCU
MRKITSNIEKAARRKERKNDKKKNEEKKLLALKDEMDKKSTLSRFIVQKKMDNANPRSEQIDEVVVQMIAVNDQPLSVVETPGFINLVKKFHGYGFRKNDGFHGSG